MTAIDGDNSHHAGSSQHVSSDVDHVSVTRRLFELFGGGPLPAWDEFDDALDSLSFESGETIFNRGETHPFVYVLTRGAVKLIGRDARGQEHLVGLAREGELLAPVRSLTPRGLSQCADEGLLSVPWDANDPPGPSDVRAVAITPTALERADFGRVLDMVDAHGGRWSAVIFHAMAFYAFVEEHRSRQFLMLTAEERYRDFLQRYPDLIGILAQKDIGSYIGVTPVGISRIAARVRASGPLTDST